MNPGLPASLKQIEPIAFVSSPFAEKFAVPRQPGLVPAARGHLRMLPGFDLPAAFDGLEGFSHIWVIFGFDRCPPEWSARVRPPRLGGNARTGVFATRSPFRPNGLGLSVLAFEGIESDAAGVRLAVAGLDLVDATPVYDIKPYVPYTDSLAQARGGFANAAPVARLQVEFSAAAELQLAQPGVLPQMRELIVQTLRLDPRPAYRQIGPEDSREYGVRLYDRDVRFRVIGDRVSVSALLPVNASD